MIRDDSATEVCARNIAPEDIVAWALDGEFIAGMTDPEAHLTVCDACSAAVASVAGASGVGGALRAAPPTAPAAIVDGAMQRVRAEASVLLLVRTLAGAARRIGQALPDYLAGGRPE